MNQSDFRFFAVLFLGLTALAINDIASAVVSIAREFRALCREAHAAALDEAAS